MEFYKWLPIEEADQIIREWMKQLKTPKLGENRTRVFIYNFAVAVVVHCGQGGDIFMLIDSPYKERE